MCVWVWVCVCACVCVCVCVCLRVRRGGEFISISRQHDRSCALLVHAMRNLHPHNPAPTTTRTPTPTHLGRVVAVSDGRRRQSRKVRSSAELDEIEHPWTHLQQLKEERVRNNVGASNSAMMVPDYHFQRTKGEEGGAGGEGGAGDKRQLT